MMDVPSSKEGIKEAWSFTKKMNLENPTDIDSAIVLSARVVGQSRLS